MGKRSLFTIASLLTAAGVLASGCTPGAGGPAPTREPQRAETPVSKATAAPTTPSSPAATPKPAAEQPKYGGILKHSAWADGGTFDLHTTGRSIIFEQASLSYSGLLQYDPEDGTRIIMDLAEKYDISPDGKKLTFVLRKDVRWHDGKPFTAEDVKFNFDRWMNPPEGVVMIRKEIVAAVERVAVVAPYTVEVYLKYPSASFIPMIAMSPAVLLPPQFLKENKTMGFTIIGTGPYKLKKYTRGVSVEHVKNEDYFVKGRPYLDGVTQYMLPDRSARFAAIRTGQVRSMFLASDNLTPSQSEILKTQMSDKVSVARFPGLGNMAVYLNATGPPFNDVRVRQAIDMVIDRKKAIDVAEGRGQISGPMVPGPWALPDEELLKRPGYRAVTPADIDRAKALLAEAGYPHGFETEVPITDRYTKQATFLLDQLKPLGIRFAVKIIDTATLETRQVAGDFSMTIYAPAQPINEPDLLLAYSVTGGGRNYGRFSDKQVDDWHQEQSITMDTAKRKELVLMAQRRIMDLAALPVMYTVLLDLPYWKCIRNFYPEKHFGYYTNLKRQDIWLADECR